MEACTKSKVRNRFKCLARKTSCQTVCWSVRSIPFVNRPDIHVIVDYFGPLLTTTRGNPYVLLFTDHFSHGVDMLAVTAAESTSEGTVIIQVNRCTPLLGYPPPFCPTADLNAGHISQPPYTNFSNKRYGPNCNVESANYTTA